MYQELGNRPTPGSVLTTSFVLCPERSSMNSRQHSGRCVGSGLIARRIAQSSRSEIIGAFMRGGSISLLIFFIHASSGPFDLNGNSPVTIIQRVAPSE